MSGWNQIVTTAVTVVGTLGGVGLGGWINARSQRELWKRQRADGVEERLRDTYTEFVLIATENRRILQQLFYFQQVSRDPEILATGEEYNRKNRDLHRAAAQVSMVGGADLGQAADRVIEGCSAFAGALREVSRAPNGSLASTTLPELNALKGSINEFVELAKAQTSP
ncbi:hypothetical protein [Actinomadura chokoriensis]|uniref:HPt domain-containing protein n=1 Tax=Actinomadura chokoriensis TaxID=454156 RepID=A0ABV4R6Z9_9ACTN